MLSDSDESGTEADSETAGKDGVQDWVEKLRDHIQSVHLRDYLEPLWLTVPSVAHFDAFKHIRHCQFTYDTETHTLVVKMETPVHAAVGSWRNTIPGDMLAAGFITVEENRLLDTYQISVEQSVEGRSEKPGKRGTLVKTADAGFERAYDFIPSVAVEVAFSQTQASLQADLSDWAAVRTRKFILITIKELERPRRLQLHSEKDLQLLVKGLVQQPEDTGDIKSHEAGKFSS